MNIYIYIVYTRTHSGTHRMHAVWWSPLRRRNKFQIFSHFFIQLPNIFQVYKKIYMLPLPSPYSLHRRSASVFVKFESMKLKLLAVTSTWIRLGNLVFAVASCFTNSAGFDLIICLNNKDRSLRISKKIL